MSIQKTRQTSGLWWLHFSLFVLILGSILILQNGFPSHAFSNTATSHPRHRIRYGRQQSIQSPFIPKYPRYHVSSRKSTSSETEATSDIKPSFYKTHEKTRTGRDVWKPRKQLKDLELGEPLEGYIVQELLEGVTGPKVFLEVGAGRYNPKTQKWQIVHAMLRLGHRNTKDSVTTKRVARLRKKTAVECYVSRVQTGCGRLEVVQNKEEVPRKEDLEKISVSALEPGQELIGTVQRVVPYGAFVDVGANRVGLLHIQKVADLYDSYIDKEKGLEEAGLERGARIRVQVESNEKKRLFLDFTPAVKEEAENERLERQKKKEKRRQEYLEKREAIESRADKGAASETVSMATTSSTSQASVEEEEAWAAYSATNQNDSDEYEQNDDEDSDDDDYDDYDEDRDIEDALGLGTY